MHNIFNIQIFLLFFLLVTNFSWSMSVANAVDIWNEKISSHEKINTVSVNHALNFLKSCTNKLAKKDITNIKNAQNLPDFFLAASIYFDG